METSLTVIESYVPGAPDRDPAYYSGLVEQVRASIQPHGLDVSLLLLPGDETALWLVRSASAATVAGGSVGDWDLPSLIAAAIGSERGHVIARQMDARLVEHSS